MKFSHPPCEDVSWNMSVKELYDNRDVILLVRMWVEMVCGYDVRIVRLGHPPCEDVSWNTEQMLQARLWRSHPLREDVSWNFCTSMSFLINAGHPPCEDVSWNVSSDEVLNLDASASSLWGWRGSITISHSDSMSGEILASFFIWVEKTPTSISGE